MQIVSLGDNLHEVSDPIFLENKKNVTNLSSAESAHSMVSFNTFLIFSLKHMLWYTFEVLQQSTSCEYLKNVFMEK